MRATDRIIAPAEAVKSLDPILVRLRDSAVGIFSLNRRVTEAQRLMQINAAG